MGRLSMAQGGPVVKDREGKELKLPLRDNEKRYCGRCGTKLRKWQTISSYCPWQGTPYYVIKVWCDHCNVEVS